MLPQFDLNFKHRVLYLQEAYAKDDQQHRKRKHENYYCWNRLTTSCKHSTHSDVTLPGCYLTLRVRSVFVFKNSPDVIDYVTTSTECHSLSHPEAEGVTEREMSW